MKTNQPYPEEFKIKAVQQITQRGHKVAEVSARIGVSQHSLYKWIKAYLTGSHPSSGKPSPRLACRGAETSQVRTAACDRGARHPKKGRRVLCQAIRVRYVFLHGETTTGCTCSTGPATVRCIGTPSSQAIAWAWT